MTIIPAINCSDSDCIRSKFERAASFFPTNTWLHIDVADGIFTYNKTWNNPEDLKSINLQFPSFKPSLEIHLMVENPEAVIGSWLRAGARRIIVHLETVSDLDGLLEICGQHNASLMISSRPEASLKSYEPYLRRCKQFQVLSVNPGLAGQRFLPLTLEKLKFLRKQVPDAKIEIDGGINLENGKRAVEAGADLLVSASYIFDAVDPGENYKRLERL